MQKSRLLWGGVVPAVLLVVLAVLFLGRVPFTVPVWRAFPAVDESIPHLLLVGKGEDMPSTDLLAPLPQNPLMKRVGVLLPLLGRMEQFALLMVLEEGLPGVYGAFYPEIEDLASLRKGELPVSWAELFPRFRMEREEGGLALFIEGESGAFILRLKERMVLFARTLEELDLMGKTLEGEVSSIAASWSFNPGWSSHFRLYDAGHLGDILFMGGIETGGDPLVVEIAWRNGTEGHDLAWRFDGVGDLLSEWGFPQKDPPPAWVRSMTLPSPLLLTLGVNFPAEFIDRFRDGFNPDWVDDLDLSPAQTDAFLSGPMVLSLGGRSKLFLFSAPGAYLQLFDRGDLGREFVGRLWDESWSSISERREALEGFPFGGGVSRPFSVVGAARDDRIIVGLLDPRQVSQEGTPARLLPFDPAGSFLWFYGDFPELASALRKWVRLGEYARNVDFEVGEMKETLGRIEKLRSLGRLSLVLQSPFEGWAFWTGENR